MTAQEPSFLPTRKQFFLLLAAYFLVHLVTRVLISETIALDEGDQVVVGQTLSWGYGPQPPLFTWLMRGFFGVFGLSIFPLALLRQLLLFGIYSLTYVNARRLTRSHAGGVATAVALQFYPTICWESERDLTHSIVAALMTLTLLLAFFRLESGRWRDYLAFGVCGGLAVLSKYNASLFYGALLLSALTLPELRGRVLDRRMAAALAVSVLVILPNALWALTHKDLAYASMYKFDIKQAMPWWPAVRLGLRLWSWQMLAHLAPVAAMLALIFWRPIFVEGKLRSASLEARFLGRIFAWLCVMVVVSIVVFKETGVKDRWLQPLFVATPLFLMVWLKDSLTPGRMKAILAVGPLVSVGVLTMIPGRILLTERLQKREILNSPFRQLAPKLAPLVAQADYIVSDDRWMAGNLRLWFNDKLAISPDLTNFFGVTGNTCLVVWEANRKPYPPPELLEFIHSFTGHDYQGPPQYIDEVWKYHRTNALRVGVVLLHRENPSPPAK
jgi:4-amino-4-deoxy-L-arabinose transferase-like glycosyltransferase